MSSRPNQRRYRKSQGRRVWVFSELNHGLRPDHIAKILTAAGLEQARLEAEALEQATGRPEIESKSPPAREIPDA